MKPTKVPIKKVLCAIYTRKSSEEGLDMEFNSLDAQRKSRAAYIASQKAEGGLELPDRYDDGGISGGPWSALPSNGCWRMSNTTGSTW